MPPRQSEQPLKNSPVSWKGLVVAMGVGVVGYGAMQYLKQEKELKMEKERTKTLGKASIGGPWTLVDQDGVTRSDTDYRVKEYVGEFSPKLIGLTGTEDQVRVAAKAYRVYFANGPKDQDEDYIVDHSVVAYLVNPDGDFIDYYAQNRTVEECYASVSAHMLKHRTSSK